MTGLPNFSEFLRQILAETEKSLKWGASSDPVWSEIKNIVSVTFHLRIIFAIVLKEEERRRIVAIVMTIYVNVVKMPIAEQKV